MNGEDNIPVYPPQVITPQDRGPWYWPLSSYIPPGSAPEGTQVLRQNWPWWQKMLGLTLGGQPALDVAAAQQTPPWSAQRWKTGLGIAAPIASAALFGPGPRRIDGMGPVQRPLPEQPAPYQSISERYPLSPQTNAQIDAEIEQNMAEQGVYPPAQRPAPWWEKWSQLHGGQWPGGPRGATPMTPGPVAWDYSGQRPPLPAGPTPLKPGEQGYGLTPEQAGEAWNQLFAGQLPSAGALGAPPPPPWLGKSPNIPAYWANMPIPPRTGQYVVPPGQAETPLQLEWMNPPGQLQKFDPKNPTGDPEIAQKQKDFGISGPGGGQPNQPVPTHTPGPLSPDPEHIKQIVDWLNANKARPDEISGILNHINSIHTNLTDPNGIFKMNQADATKLWEQTMKDTVGFPGLTKGKIPEGAKYGLEVGPPGTPPEQVPSVSPRDIPKPVNFGLDESHYQKEADLMASAFDPRFALQQARAHAINANGGKGLTSEQYHSFLDAYIEIQKSNTFRRALPGSWDVKPQFQIWRTKMPPALGSDPVTGEEYIIPEQSTDGYTRRGKTYPDYDKPIPTPTPGWPY